MCLLAQDDDVMTVQPKRRGHLGREDVRAGALQKPSVPQKDPSHVEECRSRTCPAPLSGGNDALVDLDRGAERQNLHQVLDVAVLHADAPVTLPLADGRRIVGAVEPDDAAARPVGQGIRVSG